MRRTTGRRANALALCYVEMAPMGHWDARFTRLRPVGNPGLNDKIFPAPHPGRVIGGGGHNTQGHGPWAKIPYPSGANEVNHATVVSPFPSFHS